MRVLVTGSAGLVGRAVIAELARRGDEVVEFDLASRASRASRARPSRPTGPDRSDRTDGLDIRDPRAVDRATEGCDAVVHLAALMPGAGDARAILDTNVLGTFHVLRAAERHRLARVVFVSSAAVLGCFGGQGEPEYLPLDDDHPVRPVGEYANAKALGEQMCASLTTMTGVPTICLRPPGVFGPETYRTIRRLRVENPEYEWSPVWEYGAFIDVRDLAGAVVAALTAPVCGHHRLLVCADDVSSATLDSVALVRQLRPRLPWRGGADYARDPYRALIDSGPARTLLGWAPRHRWRAG